ncbi:hypothetical protein NX059_010318 [Plenodomus lindquistii]|nr:hypothetical protein NX059_010318 [Plenodomus lindquistii]
MVNTSTRLNCAMSHVSLPINPRPGSGIYGMEKLPTELLILVASHLNNSDLLSLSSISKRCSEAAQDILYRNVNLQPHPAETKATLIVGRISRFLSTICSKPYLAAKVHSLTWWPDSKDRLLSMHPDFANMGFDSSSDATILKEWDIAAILLSRLPRLKHLSFSVGDKYEFDRTITAKKNWYVPIFTKMHFRADQLSSVAGLSMLESIHIMYRQLEWQTLTLPCLQNISLGPGALIQCPRSRSATAPNITSLSIAVEVCSHSDKQGMNNVVRVLPQLPNLRVLSLHSRTSTFCPTFYDSLGHFNATTVYALLSAAPSVQEFTLTYEPMPRFVANRDDQLSLRRFENLHKIQMAEDAFVCGLDVGVANGVTSIMWPAQVLPSGIENLIITHPSEYFNSTAHPELCMLGWLEKLDKRDFPGLRRIEVLCPVETVDILFEIMQKAYDDSESIRKLREAGLEIVVVMEEVDSGVETDTERAGSETGDELLVPR